MNTINLNICKNFQDIRDDNKFFNKLPKKMYESAKRH